MLQAKTTGLTRMHQQVIKSMERLVRMCSQVEGEFIGVGKFLEIVFEMQQLEVSVNSVEISI